MSQAWLGIVLIVSPMGSRTSLTRRTMSQGTAFVHTIRSLEGFHFRIPLRGRLLREHYRPAGGSGMDADECHHGARDDPENGGYPLAGPHGRGADRAGGRPGSRLLHAPCLVRRELPTLCRGLDPGPHGRALRRLLLPVRGYRDRDPDAGHRVRRATIGRGRGVGVVGPVRCLILERGALGTSGHSL